MYGSYTFTFLVMIMTCGNTFLMQMDKVLAPLKKISPLLKHIKLDKKKAEAFPELLTVLQCHTQCTDFMIQFF